MNLLNATKMQAGYTMGMEPDGRESIVVAVKGTFTIPENGGTPQLADEQVPLTEADEYTGEPGLSAPLYESDYARVKPRCDVILNGSAYAPGGNPTSKVTVSLSVASMKKSFNVVGNRYWDKGLASIDTFGPEPFTVMPISYNTAYGGSDHSHENPSKHKAFMQNPIGVGFHSNQQKEIIDGKPLPNTEEINQPITSPTGKYRPMALGPVGRGWEPRYELAGTYDQNWVDNIFPFLPPDFNNAYFQSTPKDQQIGHLKGGEIVNLENLTPQGKTRFSIPDISIPVVFFCKKGKPQKTKATADTLLLEPDENRFMITWRSSFPLRMNMFEVIEVLTGEMPKGWWRAKETGKTYYRSLNELALANRRKVEKEK